MQKLSIGMSEFARSRHLPNTGKTWFLGTDNELFASINRGWENRAAGDGESSLDRKIVVPVDPFLFVGTTVMVYEKTVLHACLDRRQSNEAPFIRVRALGFKDFSHRMAPVKPEPVRFAKVVLYSKDALLENGGTRTTDKDWEVVCLIASAVENEPMHYLTMARNQLSLVGGTKGTYTADQFAESVVYWSQRCRT